MYKDFLEKLGWQKQVNCQKYCQVGTTYQLITKEFDGLYWFYETEDFIIDIHDFFVRQEVLIEDFPDVSSYMTICSSYIISANGESFTPYQPLSANSLYVCNVCHKDFRFLLHGNFPYLSVGINFKDKMLKEQLCTLSIQQDFNVDDMFFETRSSIVAPIEQIASVILNCKMTSPAAEIFFEAKAKEWLSITLDHYLNQLSKKELPKDDKDALRNVSNYINDHYPLDIPRELLEKIAMMSGTKLKRLFKEEYQMSITEYTQRRRMNIAETLLLTTNLDIKSIANSVGYASHSKFSSYYKKYKGIYPKDVRKLQNTKSYLTCNHYQECLEQCKESLKENHP
ncbi:AraC-type DNA-binding protein [Granulicatella balaenopterae]|uniref:AraC-type DNA-binding protein n=1 Tax=Granulicatella balaenopterae TaxID=137733 RepID=A0A1H9IZN1_9LACT|nr:AraC family transcriptional regulator [Granulicatella balaenopterae]SEQ79992.1 AraC-type DNA-binding protein [Granulicatella balaenopterae]